MRTAAGRIVEPHRADSNRRGLRSGHLPIDRLLASSAASGFVGPFVVEIAERTRKIFTRSFEPVRVSCVNSFKPQLAQDPADDGASLSPRRR